MPEFIYILGMDGKPQMPTTRRRHVQKLLNTGRARIAEHVPFTIQLLYKNDPILQPVMLAEDPGRTNIGLTVLSLKGDLLLSAVTETRNKEITKLIDKRRACRRTSRNGERKARQRRAKRFGTTLKAGMLMRKLPKYDTDKFVTCKLIRNTESKFCNRKRPDGWLTPSARQLADTHINLIHKMQKYLPITDVAFEVNRFAFMLLKDPSVSGVDFQNGPLKGFDDLHDAVCELQDGTCLLCNRKIEHYHHIIPKSKNGSDTIDNIAGLCRCCHDKVHKNEKEAQRLQKKKKGLNKKYGALSVLNQAIPFICKRLEEEFGAEHVFYCTGRETAAVRNSFGYQKTKDNQLHEVDAWCIGILALGKIPKTLPDFSYTCRIRQFRRQDRSRIKAQTERTYKMEGKIVAKNRKKRTEQKTDSLEDWYQKQTALYGQKEADRMRSRLTAAKSQRRYNAPSRILPGTVLLYDGKRHVLSGQLTGGKYFRAVGDAKTNYPASKCRIVRKNEGLVFISQVITERVAVSHG